MPHFFWDLEDLEMLYHGTCAHLTTPMQKRDMNKKLSHCY
jgi:hypothetical protein